VRRRAAGAASVVRSARVTHRARHRRHGRIGAALAVLVAISASVWLATANPGRAASGVYLPPADPPANVPYPGTGSLAAVNRGRADEALSPIAGSQLRLLTVPEQVFVLLNLERVARSLPPFAAMTQSLDAVAQVGADTRTDPPDPPGVGSVVVSDGIEADTADPFLADFGWMYEDGCDPVANQIIISTDCSDNPPQPWAHRNRILSSPAGASCDQYMGVAEDQGVASIAAVLEFYCGAAAPSDQVFTWAQALPVVGQAPAPNTAVPCGAPGRSAGYRLAGADGGIFTFGNLPFCGSAGDLLLAAPIVGMADTPDRGGYWLVASDGGVFAYGDARFYGSLGGTRLNAPTVGMAPTTFGNGYWLVAADGGVFAFGAARFDGSMGGTRLNAPVVGMAVSPFGLGYWLVASDGGVFAFGAAHFEGSMGATELNAPIVGMAPSPFGLGYWLTASDGGVFAFGFNRFYGSLGGQHLDRPIVGITSGPFALGYWLVASDGGVFSYGDAAFSGSMGGDPLQAPVVGMSS
jgi:hypothetical protein